MKQTICYGCGEARHPVPAGSRCQISGQTGLCLRRALGPRQLGRILARLVERNGILAVLQALENVCQENDRERGGTWADVGKLIGAAAHNIPTWWATRR